MGGLTDLQNQDTRSKASFRNVRILKKIIGRRAVSQLVSNIG